MMFFLLTLLITYCVGVYSYLYGDSDGIYILEGYCLILNFEEVNTENEKRSFSAWSESVLITR